MLNRPLNSVMVRLAIVVAVLGALLAVAAVASAQSASECELDGDTVKCDYEENGIDPVASFNAADDDGDATTWSLEESGDYKKLSISADGVLTFMSPPDFDSPGDLGEDNVYNVTVLAEGGERAGGERAVEVTVTDLNEPGTVTFMGNQQPQVGETMMADLKDEDGSVVRQSWQWSKGSSMEGPWVDVKSTTTSYTPNADDIDSYLRAMVSYTDVEYDAPDTVSGVTKFAVRDRPSANAAPKFSAQSIEVFENTDGTIGTVTASDDDELVYRLWAEDDPEVDTNTDGDVENDDADNDNDRFTVTDSGELKLAAELDFEQAAPEVGDTDLRSATDIDGTQTDVADTTDIVEYTVVVTATDPSGAAGSGAVVVHLLNVDEAPAVTVTEGATENAAMVLEMGIDENESVITGQITAITFSVAPDPETGTDNINSNNSGTENNWMLEGPDASKFDFDPNTATQILFKGTASGDDGYFRPNFEDPKDADGDNVYEVTVVVPVIDSVKPGKRSVTVTVEDAEDTGKLEIAARQPQVGTTVSGALTDEDGGIRDRVWQWYRGDDNADATVLTQLTEDNNLCEDVEESDTVPCIIDKATSPTYATTDADGGFFIHLVVMYTDAFDNTPDAAGTDTATLMARPVRAVQAPPAENAAPEFGIQDRELDGDEAAPEQVTRNVDEGAKEVAEFKATDTELLVYDLGGADGGMFSLSGPSGMENSVTLSLEGCAGLRESFGRRR